MIYTTLTSSYDDILLYNFKCPSNHLPPVSVPPTLLKSTLSSCLPLHRGRALSSMRMEVHILPAPSRDIVSHRQTEGLER